MASVNNFCNLCEEDDVSKIAIVWCTDCESFLCKDCKIHHSKSKASKRHQTIALDDYKKLPSFIADIKSRCEKHDEKYDFYCKFHDDPCCVKCIKDNHKDCRDLDPLVDVLRDIKTSAKVSNLEKELSILLENFETVVNFLNSRIKNLQENNTKSVKEIRNVRTLINTHLDREEKKLMDDLSVEFDKIKFYSKHLTDEIENKKRIIQKLQNDLSNMTMYATDLQIYKGLQYFKNSASKEFEVLRDLQRKGQLDEIDLETKLSSELKSLTQHVKTFGTVVTHLSPCSLQLRYSSNYQVFGHARLTIESIKPILKRTLKIPKSFKNIEISGCQLLPDCRIILLDASNNNLLLFSKDGDYTENVICFESRPYDICHIKGYSIAVTLFNQHEIVLYDLMKRIITNTIKVTDACYGIDSNGEILVVNLVGSENKILTLDFDGNILLEMIVAGKSIVHASLYNNNIICSDWDDNCIYCYTNTGALVWTQKHEDICKPFGITIDKHGFIYVACREKNTIVILSKDGKTSRTILSKDHGIFNPMALNIDKSSSVLLVTNRHNGNAYIFKI